jgi:hypothetical protein
MAQMKSSSLRTWNCLQETFDEQDEKLAEIFSQVKATKRPEGSPWASETAWKSPYLQLLLPLENLLDSFWVETRW